MDFQGLRQTIILAFVTFCCLGGHLCADIVETYDDTNSIVVEDQVHVGVILDMRSREGKIILSCTSMALSDFYHLHDNYTTRVVLHSKDSKGEPLPALSAGEPLILSNYLLYSKVFGVNRILHISGKCNSPPPPIVLHVLNS